MIQYRHTKLVGHRTLTHSNKLILIHMTNKNARSSAQLQHSIWIGVIFLYFNLTV